MRAASTIKLNLTQVYLEQTQVGIGVSEGGS